MNGRTLAGFICVLFLIGILWMIGVIPKGSTSEKPIKLFEPVPPVPKETMHAHASKTSESSLQEGTGAAEKGVSSFAKKGGVIEGVIKPKALPPVSDQPPEVVEYNPKYGKVTFPHMLHLEGLEIDCSACHHEDIEGGMSRCANCHNPPKKAFHKTCQGCHKKLENEDKSTGPVRCRQCHIRGAA
jgi:hypothetical protein